ncbi:TPA: ribonuclease Y [Candidatus Collierbacteria bacterium]|uniref:Ribonuclease Y n=1 Tax=Candidatus Collierbacteria bacterium GW2011_GWA2_42_17 TaxID=1618378 RepID=A0A0G0Z3J4_9BACT|nr:MAG: Ribonuclease Y [Candidatus Collierbacteria bacterium GW2011_GWB2_42_12]KKS43317.1 MAG: Ribonuclease Y [Candidatus Collierbacteria bacterium GW2011_GWA2_42_17]KKS61827.1 MAG: Ribonuclease Y [Candidatus Collierbacteria bacterium GW2011_GWD2_42_50]HAI22569.1 ribonuclease Y [Candidatus Collierbacteria bacterium]HAN22226.1 ribonuclease Y [Candidatus Collierbacteria bacterium]
MSLLSIFKTNLFKASSTPSSSTSTPKTTPSETVALKKDEPKVATPSVDTAAIIAQAQAQAQNQAREIILAAKDEAFKLKDQALKDTRIQLEDIEIRVKALAQKQQGLQTLEDQVRKEKLTLEAQQKQAEEMKAKIAEEETAMAKKLEKIASLTTEQAKKELLAQVEKGSSQEIARIIKETEEKAKIEAEDVAREILVDSMRAGATDYVAEYTISTVPIPDEETKGRIIGKDGRNIRIFEKVSGCDVSMDDAPDEVKLSSFDPIRREIARVTLIRLIKDGRIHPARIEEYFDRARRDVEQLMFQEGQKLCHAVGVYNMPRDVIAVLGRFKFRTSYGQNMISHTLEETRIGIKLGNEVGANIDTIRLGCLLHDIGKVIEGEGNHVELGVNYLKKYNLPQAAIDCVAQHHEDEEFSSVESMLVYISDAISGSRPGARHENTEEYGKRIKQLEEIAKKHPEVEDAYAISAGREIRVIVNPGKAGDDQLSILAQAIRDEIRSTMTFPGTVKVNVIRETRAAEIAS